MIAFVEKLADEDIPCYPFIKVDFQIMTKMATYLELFKNSHKCLILMVDEDA